MTIDKAIEILQFHFGYALMSKGSDLTNACELGIEALKAIKHSRETLFSHRIEALPGEDQPQGEPA